MTLLTVDEFRGFVTTGLGDDELQLILDATESEIVRAAGASDSVVELASGGARFIFLARPAASITSITETNPWDGIAVTLAPDDYLIHPGGYTLERLPYGSNTRLAWWGRVQVAYAPADDEALRKGVQLDLARLMLNYQPGLTAETVGAWTTQLGSNATWNNDMEREAILARLNPEGRMVVVGG
jgi:hypothetical protein